MTKDNVITRDGDAATLGSTTAHTHPTTAAQQCQRSDKDAAVVLRHPVCLFFEIINYFFLLTTLFLHDKMMEDNDDECTFFYLQFLLLVGN
jgi:hypothetical protein